MAPLLPSLLFLLCLARSAYAQMVELTNTDWSNITSDVPFTINWKGDGTPVNITLMNGPANDLQIVKPILNSSLSTSYTWTPSDKLPTQNYCLRIDQSGSSNFSPRFTIVGIISHIPATMGPENLNSMGMVAYAPATQAQPVATGLGAAGGGGGGGGGIIAAAGESKVAAVAPQMPSLVVVGRGAVGTAPATVGANNASGAGAATTTTTMTGGLRASASGPPVVRFEGAAGSGGRGGVGRGWVAVQVGGGVLGVMGLVVWA
ncbi:hypothetical protein MMC20_001839 [Loxospora ochrophaea]|nr:hypothetical protein [Loxospora ochrophaea]